MYAGLRIVAERSVERPGFVVFDLHFDVRDATSGASFTHRFEQRAAHVPASGFGAYVEIFDAGEETAGGDVEAVGENGYAKYPVFRPGGEYLNVSGFDGPAQVVGEIPGYGFTVPE